MNIWWIFKCLKFMLKWTWVSRKWNRFLSMLRKYCNESLSNTKCITFEMVTLRNYAFSANICQNKSLFSTKSFGTFFGNCQMPNWKSNSDLPKKLCYLLDWQPFKNDEKCFLFHLKSYFRSQDIKVIIMSFWSCRKNGLIRNIRLTSKFMTSQPSLQTVAIRIFLNISQRKGNQTMKFGQLIECNKINTFLKKLYEKLLIRKGD